MLSHVAEGVLVHQSEFMQSNAVVVEGTGGVLVIDPGLRDDELACLASDLAESGRRVVMGFSTHPHWDHLLWHPELGSAQRYGTAAGAAMIQARMSTPGWEAAVTGMMPQDLVEQVPLEGFGLHRWASRRCRADPVGRAAHPHHRAPGTRAGPRCAVR